MTLFPEVYQDSDLEELASGLVQYKIEEKTRWTTEGPPISKLISDTKIPDEKKKEFKDIASEAAPSAFLRFIGGLYDTLVQTHDFSKEAIYQAAEEQIYRNLDNVSWDPFTKPARDPETFARNVVEEYAGVHDWRMNVKDRPQGGYIANATLDWEHMPDLLDSLDDLPEETQIEFVDHEGPLYNPQNVNTSHLRDTETGPWEVEASYFGDAREISDFELRFWGTEQPIQGIVFGQGTQEDFEGILNSVPYDGRVNIRKPVKALKYIRGR